jgi:citrate/tricarballylate utilization protein
MQPLDALLQTARDDGAATRPVVRSMTANETEVDRLMTICNACRYCEGFCAVFPAMTRRLAFNKADVNYLANLCHNCSACYHACQYAPPHEFAVNVPQAMAKVRLDTYTEYAWPAGFGALYKRNGLTVALATAFGLALFLLLAIARNGTLFSGAHDGNFYAIFPHGLMANLFGAVFGFSILALGVGVFNFWRDVSPGSVSTGLNAAVLEAATDIAVLTNLGGGHGEGCNEADDRFTLARRRYHHLTFYGFLLCFASTSLATLYRGFIALLLLVSATGLALLAWRDSAALGILLAVHLGMVMALFLTLPYGKFAHGFFRAAALLKSSIEKRQPNRLQAGSE